jgi:uncharacterized DUF497 family protein
VGTVRVGEFEWNDAKARTNFRKHGVSFEEAMTVFLDDLAVPYEEGHHLNRLVLIGESQLGRVLLIVFTERVGGGIIRIISARRATKTERSLCRRGLSHRNDRCGTFPRSISQWPNASDVANTPKWLVGPSRSLSSSRDCLRASENSEAINAALRALIEAADTVRHPAKAKRSPRAKRTAA